MKNLLIICFIVLSVNAFTQDQMFDCNGQQVVVANVTCADDVLQFTVTATNLQSSAFISPLPPGSNLTPIYGSSQIFSNTFEISPTNSSAILMIPSTACSEVFNGTLAYNDSCPGNPFSLIIAPAPIAPIPTLGQWGIILLALLIAIGGIITSRKRVLASE